MEMKTNVKKFHSIFLHTDNESKYENRRPVNATTRVQKTPDEDFYLLD